jgi:tRNA modification GTPase
LFNALVGQERAIVTDVPGTTRDFLTEKVEIDGLAVTLVDTAGVREANDVIEREGVARAARARAAADLVIAVVDSSVELNAEDTRLIEEATSHDIVLVASKADLPCRWLAAHAIRVSAVENAGLDELRRAIVGRLTGVETPRDSASVSNLRHVTLLKEAASALCRARRSAESGESEEFVLGELHQARSTLSEIVGGGASDEVLNHIFANFCVGK